MAKKIKNKKFVISKEKIWQSQKPRFNGFVIGHGPHGDTKYNRNKNKQDFKNEINPKD